MGFNSQQFINTHFSDYTIEFEKAENDQFYYTRIDDYDGIIYPEDRVATIEGKKKIKLDYSLFDKDVLIIDHMKSSTVKLLNCRNNSGLEIKKNGFKSEDYRQTVIFLFHYR